MPAPSIAVSIVSHRQALLVNGLLEDLAHSCESKITVLLTQNVPDAISFATDRLACPVEVIANDRVKGFGANHNAAFARCRTPYFCVVNPDVRLASDPFPALVASLEDGRAGAAGPLVRSPAGEVEDSARRFPTTGFLIRKALGARSGPDYPSDRGPQVVDWIGGMFMLLRSEAFRAVGGFDEAYFLYYEDVDLCRRLNHAGRAVIYQPAVEVVHDARRASRRDPRFAMHHLKSVLRFLSRS